MSTTYTTQRLTGSELRKGMIFDGLEIKGARPGVGSGKKWTFFIDTDGVEHRCRKNTVRYTVEVPVIIAECSMTGMDMEECTCGESHEEI